MSRRRGTLRTEALVWRVWETSRPGLSYGEPRSRGGPPFTPPSVPVPERAASRTRTSRPRCPCLFQSRRGLELESSRRPPTKMRAPRAPQDVRTSQRPPPVLPLPRSSKRGPDRTLFWTRPISAFWIPPTRARSRSAFLLSPILLIRGPLHRRRRPVASRPAHLLCHDAFAERNVAANETPGFEDGSLAPIWSSLGAVPGSQPLPVSMACIGCLRSNCLTVRSMTSPTRASSMLSARC